MTRLWALLLVLAALLSPALSDCANCCHGLCQSTGM
jgi:hypothetical protein